MQEPEWTIFIRELVDRTETPNWKKSNLNLGRSLNLHIEIKLSNFFRQRSNWTFSQSNPRLLEKSKLISKTIVINEILAVFTLKIEFGHRGFQRKSNFSGTSGQTENWPRDQRMIFSKILHFWCKNFDWVLYVGNGNCSYGGIWFCKSISITFESFFSNILTEDLGAKFCLTKLQSKNPLQL